MLAIIGFDTPDVYRISRKPPPSLAVIFDSGGPLPTRSTNGIVESTRTSGRIPTLLPTEESIHLASVDGNLNSPAPLETSCA